MIAVKQLAEVILAAAFVAIFAGLYLTYQGGSAIAAFERDAEQLAQLISLLSTQDNGTQNVFSIEVPAGCELRFEDNAIIVVINNVPENFDVGVSVSGPTFTNQKIKLTLHRVENGVEISG